MLNSFNGIGRLTADAELIKKEEAKKSFLKFSLAISKNKEETDFLPCIVWGEYAMKLSEFLTKGKLIAVQGAIHTSTYEKEGEKRNSFSIQCDKIILLDSKNKE
ncbi:single-stranded DNA-binding protein [Fusobacterium gastrosuis]|uniref:single-stranded DNA-binding protein n=1 Tax=Fusobacterium gastrosuis TaxID=1755100 RepID=UPI00297670C0|nr:single-stranded DNA-binding protein [Fusobacteriaceae bacterium]MDY5714300.1 single-stranded DNA-binding protein [Fusobacterium gastrosuis]